jgi:hypothetical protein
MTEKGKDYYEVPLWGKVLSKREANKVGIAIIVGLVGATLAAWTLGSSNKILAFLICALFAGVGLWLGDKIFKK